MRYTTYHVHTFTQSKQLPHSLPHFGSLANTNERNVHGSRWLPAKQCCRQKLQYLISHVSWDSLDICLALCPNLDYCIKWIVISTSDLLSECQESEHITCMDSKSMNRLVKNPRHITPFTSPTKPISQKRLHHKCQTTTRTSVVRRKMTYSMHTLDQFLYSYTFNTDVLPNKQQIVQLCKRLWPEIKTGGYWNVIFS